MGLLDSLSTLFSTKRKQAKTSSVKNVTTKLTRQGRIKNPTIRVTVDARFEPIDSTTPPTTTQLKSFLVSTKENVVLPTINGKTQTLKDAKRAIDSINIKSFPIRKPPRATWLDSLVYELTGVKFAEVKKNPKISKDAKVTFVFDVDMKKIGKHFRTAVTEDILDELDMEMKVRAEKSINQEVYFHYFTTSGRKYAKCTPIVRESGIKIRIL